MTDLSNYPALERIVQRLQRLSEPKKKYEQLIYYAKRLPEFPEFERIPENKVPGCTSLVYVTAKLDGEKVLFQGDADSQIVKGLVGVLVEGLSGLTPRKYCKLPQILLSIQG
jgi:cysteine desulfuration protein SufE